MDRRLWTVDFLYQLNIELHQVDKFLDAFFAFLGPRPPKGDEHSLYQLNIELHQVDKFLDAFFHLGLGEFKEAFRSEFFHAEGSHGRSVDDAPFHVVKRYVARMGQVADEATGKSVTGAGGIKYFFMWRVRYSKITKS